MKRELYIFGANGMAQVVGETVIQLGNHELVGFVDDTSNKPKELYGLKVFQQLPPSYASPQDVKTGNFEIILAFGDCDARLAIGERLSNSGYYFATIIHPSAIVSPTAQIGKGVFIGANAVIEPFSVINDFSIINTGAIVCHGTKIGKACHLAPTCTVAGNTSIGNCCWIGLGAKVIEKLHLGSRTFVGAGSVVIRNTNPNSLVYGIPAKEIKSR